MATVNWIENDGPDLNFRHRQCQRPTCAVAAGWLDGEPSKLTGRFEIRPAAEQGPIIVCLDTSGAAIAHQRRALDPELISQKSRTAYLTSNFQGLDWKPDSIQSVAQGQCQGHARQWRRLQR